MLCVVGSVRGVTYLDNIIYVVCYDSSAISLYDMQTLEKLSSVIDIDGMTASHNMVVCHSGRQLYIADCDKCIWRVSVDDHSQYDKWLQTKYWIRSLSVTSQRLLVTPLVPSATLRLVSTTDAAQIGVVRLPRYMREPYHAVETTRGTCVVAHWGTSQDKRQDAVSRVVTCCVALFISRE